MRPLPLLTATICLNQLLNAEISLGDNGSIGYGANASITSTSNATLDSSETSDTIYKVEPKVVYRSAGGAAQVEAYVSTEIIRYSDLDENDSEDIKSGIVVDIDNEPLKLRFNAGYVEQTAARAAVLGEIIETADLTLSAQGEYIVTDNYFIRSGVDYRDSEAKTEGYASVETIKIPVELFYTLDSAISLGAGYTYSDVNVSDVSRGGDAEDHAFYAALENTLSPILRYSVKLGGKVRSFDESGDFEDTEAFFANVTASWSVSEITTANFIVSNDFTTTAANQSSEVFTLGASLEHSFADNILATVGTTFRDISYDQVAGDRDDENWSVYGGVDYSFMEDRMTLSGTLSYSENTSDTDNPTNIVLPFSADANYDVFEASVTLSFLF